MKQHKAILKLDDLSLYAGGKAILSHVNFEMALKGTSFFRGANGAGKTTFLQALLGLAPIEGHIFIDGKIPQQARQSIGYMPQRSAAIAPMLPVKSYVEACIQGQKWGVPLGSRKEQALELLSLTGATHVADKPIGVLSGGEYQRVALAQALAGHPKILILDEPLAALDDKGRETMLMLIHHLSHQLDVSILMTVHGAINIEKWQDDCLRELYIEGRSIHASI